MIAGGASSPPLDPHHRGGQRDQEGQPQVRDLGRRVEVEPDRAVAPAHDAHREVEVLARSVEPGEGLLVGQRDPAVPLSHLAQQMHGQQVLVGRAHRLVEHGRELELLRRHLVVIGRGHDAQPRQLLIELLEEVMDIDGDAAQVVLRELLVARRRGAHHQGAAMDQVRPLAGVVLGQQEVLLLRPSKGADLDLAPVEPARKRDVEEPLHRPGQGGLGPQRGRLQVQGLSVVRDEQGGDAEGGAVQDEQRGLAVPHGVAPSLVRGPEPARGLARSVGLALKQGLGAEVGDVVPLVGRRLGPGVEPVRVLGHPAGDAVLLDVLHDPVQALRRRRVVGRVGFLIVAHDVGQALGLQPGPARKAGDLVGHQVFGQDVLRDH